MFHSRRGSANDAGSTLSPLQKYRICIYSLFHALYFCSLSILTLYSLIRLIFVYFKSNVLNRL